VATRAEALGFDSVWVSDHVVIPSQIASPYPYDRPEPFTPDEAENVFEALTTMAFVAGRTERILVGSSVLVIPQREPILLAKQIATTDALCGGRLIVGVGVGWLREEFEALGVRTFDQRGAVADDELRLFRALWTQEGDISFHGATYRVDGVRFLPKPARRPGPPIWVGGNTRAALRRAAALGDAWHVIRMDLETLHRLAPELRAAAEQAGRAPDAVEITTRCTLYGPGAAPKGPARDWDLVGSAAEVAARIVAFREAGVRHLLLDLRAGDAGGGQPEVLEYFARDIRPLL
jgi:probable F420-dependent oxidoreductase